MLSLDDPKWRELKGGYKVPYDVSIALKRFEHGEHVWEEFWNELHHQGDVGEASYAALPHLVRIGRTLPCRDWNFYGLFSCIETERHRKSNPPIPDWLTTDYEQALRDFLELAISDLKSVNDQLTLQSVLGGIALAKGALEIGALLSTSTLDEIKEQLENYYAWSELFE